MGYTRRSVLASLGLAGFGVVLPPLVRKAAASSLTESLAAGETGAGTCPLRLAANQRTTTTTELGRFAL